MALYLRVLGELGRSSSDTDRDLFARYLWNIALGEALYPALQGFEVTLRNRLHEAATAHYGTPWWFDHTKPGSLKLRSLEAHKVKEATQRVPKSRKPMRHTSVIRALGLGFWTGLFNRYYVGKGFLEPLLKPTFPHLPRYNRTPKFIRDRLDKTRHFRNRVFHHEQLQLRYLPDLQQQYWEVLEAIGWMSSNTRHFVEATNRFPDVYISGLARCEEQIDDIIAPQFEAAS